MAKQIILIAGNICAGKSYTVNYIANNKSQFNLFLNSEESIQIVPEFIDPIARKAFYNNRKDNSAIFELSCLSGRIVRHLDAKGELTNPDNHLYFFDRGMIEGAETFCLNSFKDGFMSHQEYKLYLDTLKMGLDRLDRSQQNKWLEQIIIYLEVKDEKILAERQRLRADKTKEELIPLSYFRQINDRYHYFFENIDNVYDKYGVNAPQVISIDASWDIISPKDHHKVTLEKIIEKMKEMNINGKR